MITLIADTHTHTVATDHAYSTIGENTAQAARIGQKILCWTEHAPKMLGGPSSLFFAGIYQRDYGHKRGGAQYHGL